MSLLLHLLLFLQATGTIFSPNWPTRLIWPSSCCVSVFVGLCVCLSPPHAVFYQMGPLGRFGLVVAMSVSVCVCGFVCLFVPSPCNFHQIGPLGRFGLLVAMSVFVCVCRFVFLSVPSPCTFFFLSNEVKSIFICGLWLYIYINAMYFYLVTSSPHIYLFNILL